MTDIDRENDVFSNDTTCDFQTAHMINKIKNVKPNAKKRKKLLNIQNIEPLINFTTLSFWLNLSTSISICLIKSVT